MLTRTEWVEHDLCGLAELAASGQVSRREILETSIAQIEQLNPSLNAVVVDRFDEALSDVGALDEAADLPRFAGMPYLLKDLHAPVKDLPLANGSERFHGTQYDFDSAPVARLRASGLAFLGRTAAPEFGLTITTESKLWGVTHNPWHPGRSAGGSSGGAGAAVASGMLPAAHATDSAGSIRIPAAYNGLIGFKPSRGLVPFGPHRGDPTFGMSHEHAVTRSVRDSAALLDLIAGPDPGCPYFTPAPAGGFEAAITDAPDRLRIGFLSTHFDGGSINTDSCLAVEQTAAACEALGHDVVAAGPDFDSHQLNGDAFRLLVGSLAGLFPAEAASERIDGLEPMTQAMVRFAAEVSLHEQLTRAAAVSAQVRLMSMFFEDYDVLITASTNGPASPLGHLDLQAEVDVDVFTDQLLAVSPFTAPFNASGQPAMTLPVHQTADGLPIGAQIITKLGNDSLLMQLAAQLETAAHWNSLAPAA